MKYECDKCARSYKWKSYLSIHKKYGCGVTPQFMCVLCNKQFSSKNSLSRHIDNLHSERSISKKVHN